MYESLSAKDCLPYCCVFLSDCVVLDCVGGDSNIERRHAIGVKRVLIKCLVVLGFSLYCLRVRVLSVVSKVGRTSVSTIFETC